MTKRRSWTGLCVFLAVLIVVSGGLEWQLIRLHEPIEQHLALTLPLMWVPALASLAARAVQCDGLDDVSFRFGGWIGARETLRGWIFPVIVGGCAYGLAWALGLVEFTTHRAMFLGSPSSPTNSILNLLVVQLTVNTLVNTIATAGEEIGWRGYLLTRLIESGVPFPILVSCLIWAAWHAPLIIGGVYASSAFPGLSAAMFALSIVGQGFLLAYVRLASGSVWPAVIGHAAWNAVIQGVFDRSSGAQVGVHWVGEDGILVALASVIIAIAFTFRKRPLLLTPGKSLASVEPERT
jgi:membrane protease YdiL (CAAX protease family)